MGTIFESPLGNFPTMNLYGGKGSLSFGPPSDFKAGTDRPRQWGSERGYYEELAAPSSEVPELSSRPSSRNSSRPSSFCSGSRDSTLWGLPNDTALHLFNLNPRIADEHEPLLQHRQAYSSYTIPENSSWPPDHTDWLDPYLPLSDETFSPAGPYNSDPRYFSSLSEFSQDAKLQIPVRSDQFSDDQRRLYHSRESRAAWDAPDLGRGDGFSSQLHDYQSHLHLRRLPPKPETSQNLDSEYSARSAERSYETRGMCPDPHCGKSFKDLKAHMLTHRKERPEKCPVDTCEYHVKGFCRKYDQQRHTLTHFKGTLACCFCQESVAPSEKYFNRADVFKRHLVSIHGAQYSSALMSRKGSSASFKTHSLGPLEYNQQRAGWNCSLCSSGFPGVQSFFNHLDGCVVNSVVRHASILRDSSAHEGEFKEGNSCIAHTEHFTVSNKIHHNTNEESEHSCSIESDRSDPQPRRDYHRSFTDLLPPWAPSGGYQEDQQELRGRVMYAFDATQRLWKDQSIFPADFERNILLRTGIPFIQDLESHNRESEVFDNSDWYEYNLDLMTSLNAPKEQEHCFMGPSYITCASSAPAACNRTKSLPAVHARSPREVFPGNQRRQYGSRAKPLTFREIEARGKFDSRGSLGSKASPKTKKHFFSAAGSLSQVRPTDAKLSDGPRTLVNLVPKPERQGKLLKNGTFEEKYPCFTALVRNSKSRVKARSTGWLGKVNQKNTTGGNSMLRRASNREIPASTLPQMSADFKSPELLNEWSNGPKGSNFAIFPKENLEVDIKKEADELLSKFPDINTSTAETPRRDCGSFAPSPETDDLEDVLDDESISDCSTNWGDEQNTASPDSDVYRVLAEPNTRHGEEQDGLLRPILSPIKQALVDRIMSEFWTIVNQEWAANLTRCAGETPSSSSPPGSNGSLIGGSSPRLANRKRPRDDGQDPPPDDNNSRTPKRPNSQIERSPSKNGVKFACPYRKHSPQQYTIYSHRSCALSHWDTVARVKEHLYRRHRVPIQCKRCWQAFKTQEALDAHLTVVSICPLQPGHVTEGLTADLEKKLKSRKKSSPNQTEEARWKEIYGLLFPNQVVPSPYFEPVQENIPQSPDSRELADYEEYSRQELPRYFRSHLEDAVNNETQNLEEHIRSHLVSIVQDCQAEMFLAYKSRNVNKDTKPIAESTKNEACVTPPASQISSDDAVDPTKLESKNIVTSVYQAPPPTPQSTLQYIPDVRDMQSADMQSNIPANLSFSDSAYSSNGTISSQSLSTQPQTRDNGSSLEASNDLSNQLSFGEEDVKDDNGNDNQRAGLFEDSYDTTWNTNDQDFNFWWAHVDGPGPRSL